MEMRSAGDLETATIGPLVAVSLLITYKLSQEKSQQLRPTDLGGLGG